MSVLQIYNPAHAIARNFVACRLFIVIIVTIIRHIMVLLSLLLFE
jgi:hypothetical protein